MAVGAPRVLLTLPTSRTTRNAVRVADAKEKSNGNSNHRSATEGPGREKSERAPGVEADRAEAICSKSAGRNFRGTRGISWLHSRLVDGRREIHRTAAAGNTGSTNETIGSRNRGSRRLEATVLHQVVLRLPVRRSRSVMPAMGAGVLGQKFVDMTNRFESGRVLLVFFAEDTIRR
jgi:hypothetical protein